MPLRDLNNKAVDLVAQSKGLQAGHNRSLQADGDQGAGKSQEDYPLFAVVQHMYPAEAVDKTLEVEDTFDEDYSLACPLHAHFLGHACASLPDWQGGHSMGTPYGPGLRIQDDDRDHYRRTSFAFLVVGSWLVRSKAGC